LYQKFYNSQAANPKHRSKIFDSAATRPLGTRELAASLDLLTRANDGVPAGQI
jgi:hypothetical protein